MVPQISQTFHGAFRVVCQGIVMISRPALALTGLRWSRSSSNCNRRLLIST